MKKLKLPKVMPEEFLLGAMIAAAAARGLRSCTGSRFKRAGWSSYKEEATHCCALGAIELLEGDLCQAVIGEAYPNGHYLVDGNDGRHVWSNRLTDGGESVGNAFYEALQ